MWQIYCRVRHSIGFSGNVTLAATLGHGGSWVRLCGTGLEMIPKPSKPSPKLCQCSRGKTESAHDYALRFETVLEKIPRYEESWVRNLFVCGLHSHLATQVNMQNPATLNRAIQLAKKADVAIQLSRRPGASGSGSTQQKTKAAGSKPNTVNDWQGSPGIVFIKIKNVKSNKNWYRGTIFRENHTGWLSYAGDPGCSSPSACCAHQPWATARWWTWTESGRSGKPA